MTGRIVTIALALVATAGAARTAAGQEAPVELRTPSGVLQGTLLIPAGATGTVPVALIIAGSGPTDRDGNSPMLPGKNNSLKMLAEALATMGVASVRYDKRGIGASVGAARSEAELRFTDYVDDAAAWVRSLAADRRFSTVMLAGHSEGSLIGIMAAQRGSVSRVVSLAGAGRPIFDILDEQLARNLGGMPALLEESKRIMGELRAGRQVPQVSPALAVLYRPSVQPYLISWLGIDPAQEAGRLKIPLLVVQGTTDVQTAAADAERLAAASPLAKLAMIDGMNHVLKEVREEAMQVASYSNPGLPLHPGLVGALREFLRTP